MLRVPYPSMFSRVLIVYFEFIITITCIYIMAVLSLKYPNKWIVNLKQTTTRRNWKHYLIFFPWCYIEPSVSETQRVKEFELRYWFFGKSSPSFHSLLAFMLNTTVNISTNYAYIWQVDLAVRVQDTHNYTMTSPLPGSSYCQVLLMMWICLCNITSMSSEDIFYEL